MHREVLLMCCLLCLIRVRIEGLGFTLESSDSTGISGPGSIFSAITLLSFSLTLTFTFSLTVFTITFTLISITLRSIVSNHNSLTIKGLIVLLNTFIHSSGILKVYKSNAFRLTTIPIGQKLDTAGFVLKEGPQLILSSLRSHKLNHQRSASFGLVSRTSFALTTLDSGVVDESETFGFTTFPVQGHAEIDDFTTFRKILLHGRLISRPRQTNDNHVFLLFLALSNGSRCSLLFLGRALNGLLLFLLGDRGSLSSTFLFLLILLLFFLPC